MTKPMTVTPDFGAENAEFERQAAERNMPLEKLPGGFYADQHTQSCWWFWVGRAAFAANGIDLGKPEPGESHCGKEGA